MNITKAILSLRPGALWSMHDNDYNKLEWLDEEQTKPTKEELEEEVVRLKNAQEAELAAIATAKQSALNKLMALGLTEEEALALGK